MRRDRRRSEPVLRLLLMAWLPVALSCAANDLGGAPTAPGSTPPAGFVFDSTASLPLGRTVSVDRGRLRLTLAAILADSRCPQNVRCIQIGSVKGTLTAARVGGGHVDWTFEVYEGSLAPNGEFTTPPEVGRYTLGIQRVEPAPVAGVTIPPSAYVAHVRVRRLAP